MSVEALKSQAKAIYYSSKGDQAPKISFDKVQSLETHVIGGRALKHMVVIGLALACERVA